MKRCIAMLLALTLLLAGCGNAPDKAGFDGSMEELVAKIYENHGEIELGLLCTPVDLSNPDMVQYNLGLSDGSVLSDAAISEPMISSIPYSLLVVRVKKAADAQSVAEQMLQNIDTRKWVCVEADTKTAVVAGDVVMFFMIGSEYTDLATTDSMVKAFQAAVGGGQIVPQAA